MDLSAASSGHGLSYSREIVIAHVVLLAITTRRMPLMTIRHFAGRPAIDALALGRQATIATHLLVVAKTIALGNLTLATAIYPALSIALAILPLWCQTTMAANLLIMPWAKSSRPRLRVATCSPANCPPLTSDNLAFHIGESFLKDTQMNYAYLGATTVPYYNSMRWEPITAKSHCKHKKYNLYENWH